MALTRNFKETILARVERDPDFRKALLDEAVLCLISDDAEIGKLVLCDYIDVAIRRPKDSKSQEARKIEWATAYVATGRKRPTLMVSARSSVRARS